MSADRPTTEPRTEAGRSLLAGDFIEADYDGCTIDENAFLQGILAIEAEVLDELLDIYDALDPFVTLSTDTIEARQTYERWLDAIYAARSRPSDERVPESEEPR